MCSFVKHELVYVRATLRLKVWYRAELQRALIFTRVRQTGILRQSRMVLSRLAESTTSLRDFSR